MSVEINERQLDGRVRTRQVVTVVVAIVSLLAVSILSVVIKRHIDKSNDPSNIFGVWVEQGVPGYDRDIFTINEDGVYINERLIDTHFSFNGKKLVYHYEDKEYIYLVKNESKTAMRRVAPTHYKSVFHLRGKYRPKSH